MVYRLSSAGRAITWKKWQRLAGGRVMGNREQWVITERLGYPEGEDRWDDLTLGELAGLCPAAGRSFARFAVEHLERPDLAEEWRPTEKESHAL